MNYQKLVEKVKNAYEGGISIPEAESLAGEFLAAMFHITDELKITDLDSRMRKNGYKAARAAIYMDEVTKGEKKPTEAYIQSAIDLNPIVQTQMEALDKAEVERDRLQNYYNIFREAHIFFRGMAKGRFE